MAAMTAQADKRLALTQQVVCYCAVRLMADRAVFNNRGMLKNEGPLVFRMALKADII